MAPGEIDVELPFRPDLTQQHGFVSAGIITAIADTACGFAAMTLMPDDAGVLTVEYKVNFMSPARGERFAAKAHVIKAGRIPTVCAADVFTLSDGEEKPVAAMLTTMIAVQGRAEVSMEAG